MVRYYRARHRCYVPGHHVNICPALQMPPGSLDFTTFSWPVLLKRLGQMAATGPLWC